MTKDNDKNCGIYCWTNKVNGKRYIGQSIDLHRRKRSFLYFDKPYSGDLINKARDKYNSPDYWNYEILEYCSPEDLCAKEEKYISLYNTCSRDYGYNLTTGGENYEFTEDIKERIGKAHRIPVYQIDYETDEIIKEWDSASTVQRELGISSSSIIKCCRGKRSTIGCYRWCYVGNIIPRREKISLKGKPNPKNAGERNQLYMKHHTEEHKEKLRNILKGRKISEEHREALRVPKKNYTIRQYSLETGELINEFESIAEATRQTNVCRTGIRLNLKGEYTQAGGYRWEYGSPIKRPKYSNCDKAIVQLNERGEIIAEWSQMKQAEEALGISHQTIVNICKSRTQYTRTGLILRYKEEYDPDEVISNLPKIIVQLDDADNIIKEWLSPSQAAKDLNIRTSTIYRYLDGTIKRSRNGLIIRYKYSGIEN